MIEAAVEDYLGKRARAAGGEVRKVTWLGRRGAPDRLVLLPDRHPLVELKRPRKKAEAHQLREHARLRKAGFEVYVLDSIEAVDVFFSEMGADLA